MDEHLQKIQDRIKLSDSILGFRLPFQTVPQHDGSAHVEFLDGRYHYVVTERGSECVRRVAADESEILYWLTSDSVFRVACEYELSNRIEGQDARRLLFAKQIELLGLVDSTWAQRKHAEIESILQSHPYNDSAKN